MLLCRSHAAGSKCFQGPQSFTLSLLTCVNSYTRPAVEGETRQAIKFDGAVSQLKGNTMKKSFVLVCFVSAFAVSSCAQTPASVEGARLVALRDAAYAKAHPTAAMTPSKPIVKHRAHRKAVQKVTK